ncbi:terpene synthase 10-like [Impatiens glandulifera]|uniref:terpene synthase 10-like n=1 Tax=Impatiens glandulifera TaxID=253017 RepID=UPI001FB19B8B|nr:terpene synthase 10-like [Impatiens glandulifera]
MKIISSLDFFFSPNKIYRTNEKSRIGCKQQLRSIPAGFFVGHQLSWQTKVSTNQHCRNKQLINCSMSTTVKELNDEQTIVRRCANYGPTIWKYEYIQSLNSNYVGEEYEMKEAKLKEEVKIMILEKMETSFQKLELIEKVKRLGVSYHFEKEIESCLDAIYNETNWSSEVFDLNETSLRFRLFRQHGYNVSPDVFDKFIDQNGNFKKHLSEDIVGLLSLYEASYLAVKEESTLDDARKFAAKHLKENSKIIKNSNLAMLVNHALEVPLHWAMKRFEARWFIDAYSKQEDVNKTLLNFAKLDFNMVQAEHQEELKHASRWWENLGWDKKVPFLRDRLLECYLWTLADPQNEMSYYGRMCTRVNQLITSIDDIYDVYGTLDELDLFTNAVLRWDVNLVETLPDYMKICFLGNVNSVNELGYEALKNEGVHALPYLIKVWKDLCGCYMKEATWFHEGHVPSLDEYLNHAWMSVGIPLVINHAYFLCASTFNNPITEEGLEAIKNYHEIIKWPSMVVRLVNDLATSKKELERGDVLKSVQLYMHETGASEEEAQEYIKGLIRETWKKINTARTMPDCPFEMKFVDVITNIARIAHYMYQYEDAHGYNIDGKNKDRVTLLLIEPIPLSLD